MIKPLLTTRLQLLFLLSIIQLESLEIIFQAFIFLSIFLYIDLSPSERTAYIPGFVGHSTGCFVTFYIKHYKFRNPGRIRSPGSSILSIGITVLGKVRPVFHNLITQCFVALSERSPAMSECMEHVP